MSLYQNISHWLGLSYRDPYILKRRTRKDVESLYDDVKRWKFPVEARIEGNNLILTKLEHQTEGKE